MKKLCILILVFSFSSLVLMAQDSNVLIGLNAPANGITIKTNFPTGSGGWARGFKIANQDNSVSFFTLGSFGSYANGVSSLGYSYLGESYNKTHIVFLPNGNIGIGTTSPTEKFYVKGSVRLERADGGNHFLINSDAQGNYITTDDPGANQKNLFVRIAPTGDNAVDRHIYLQAGKVNGVFQTRMFINGNGNIGIGTNAPKEKLSVNGNIRAREVKVETANWPDYVFAEAYQPMSLSNLKTFVKENKHLPGIPSAREVKEEGISLGEMNRKLLEKIEELTLHVIKQQEELNNVKTELETIKKRD